MTRKQPTPFSVNRAIKANTARATTQNPEKARMVQEAITRITGTTIQPLTPSTEDDQAKRNTCRNCTDRVHVPDERTGLIHVTGKYVCNRGVKYGRAERIYVAERRDYL